MQSHQNFMGWDGQTHPRARARAAPCRFEEIAPNLAGNFGLRDVSFPMIHHSKPRLHDDDLSSLEEELCAIVEPEYKWMGDIATFHKRCHRGKYKPLES